MRVAALWTGGKDCCLAMHAAQRDGHEIAMLVTFGPPEPRFIAHPTSFLARQAASIGLEWEYCPMPNGSKDEYRAHLSRLRDERGITGVVTGDLEEVHGCPNWIVECCEPLRMEVLRPLWKRPRRELWRDMLAAGYRVLISCVDRNRMDRAWVGREITVDSFAEFASYCDANSIDLCGENGEFHSLVLAAPMMREALAANGVVTDAGEFSHFELRSGA